MTYGLDRASFNQGKNAQFDFTIYEEVEPTITARGPAAVCHRLQGHSKSERREHACVQNFWGGGCENMPHYIVRRLMPVECARLQGFSDEWGVPDHKDDFTDEEYKFWLNVRNEHARINGKTQKQYTKEAMLKWYNKLHADSSEYKMWGNGIGLPNAYFVMKGIADNFERSRTE